MSKLLYLFTFLLFLFSFNLQSQNQDSVHHRHGLHIVSEKNFIQVVGTISTEINVTVTKKTNYFIHNRKGIDYLSKISLNDTFDSTFIGHYPKARNYKELLSELEINYFSIKSNRNGKTKNLSFDKEEEFIQMLNPNNRYGNFKRVHFMPKGINIGDTIEVSYSYTSPYRLNYTHFLSSRIFFNSSIYKENYNLQISYPERVNVEFFPRNNGEQDSIQLIGNKRVYHWTKQNLRANLLEKGARPYTELPYVILSIKPLDYIYLPEIRPRGLIKTSGLIRSTLIDEYIPTYAIYSFLTERNQEGITRSMERETNRRQINLLRKFYTIHSLEEQNNNNYLKLKSLKNYIADNLVFLNDTNYYKQYDNSDIFIGNNLMRNELRDISRYDLYLYLIGNMKLPYFTAYIGDNRSGFVDDAFFRPMAYSDYFFLPITSDTLIQYLLPKSEDFGFYLNEYPFYYENSIARLIHYTDYINDEFIIKDQPRYASVPKNNFEYNRRTTSVAANVSSKDNSINFTARVNLSGQYSTMTRGLYLKEYIDETVNPLYYRKLWDIDETTLLKKSDVKILEDIPPFKTNIDAMYTSNSSVKTYGDTLEINIEGLINHITNAEACLEKRTLSYYPDFLGTDKYVYVFQFEEPIILADTSFNTNLRNSFGEYIFQVEQTTESTIKISSYFSVFRESVSANEFQEVCELYQAIAEQGFKRIKLLK